MRTNIDIDDKLMAEAMAVSGAATKRETVELGLKKLVRQHALERVLELKGIGWVGDLDEMRRD